MTALGALRGRYYNPRRLLLDALILYIRMRIHVNNIEKGI